MVLYFVFRKIDLVDGKDYDIYDSHGLQKAFPTIKTNNNYTGCVDKNSGVLRADRALAATLVRAQNLNSTTLVFNALVLRNNIPCNKLTKSFRIRYSTSYTDPGLKMREDLPHKPVP
jgi:hypothetical protein